MRFAAFLLVFLCFLCFSLPSLIFAAEAPVEPNSQEIPATPSVNHAIPSMNLAYLSHPRVHYPPNQAFVRQAAPAFSASAVVDGAFRSISNREFLGRWLIMVFFPAAFTFVCPTELISFSDRVAEFHSLNAEVVAVSVDNQHSLLAWSKMARQDGGLGKMKIPMIADITKTISATYGVLLENEGISLRGLIMIDPKGLVRQITINDLPVGRSVDETIRLLKAFQYADRHGEVCPANWQPGEETIVPDPVGAQAFFKKQKDL